MLSLNALASAGTNLRDDMLPEALTLAQRIGAMIEISANGVLFWVYPHDTVEALQDAFDRLYPKSRIVSVRLSLPVEKGGE